MAFGALVEAEYTDGFVLTEDGADRSPYDEGRNTFHAIANGRPEADHGPMVRWSLITPAQTYSVAWTELVALEAVPMYERDMERDFVPGEGWSGPPRCVRHRFGWRGEGPEGPIETVQEILL